MAQPLAKPNMNVLTITCFALLATVAHVHGASLTPRLSLYPLAIDSRIANGQDAEPHAYPYQIALRMSSGLLAPFQHHCGGCLINNLWFISAAHCFTEGVSRRANFQASAGRHYLASNAATIQNRNVARWILHPGYTGGVAPHDIALVRVASAFTFTDAVAPIALPARNTVHSGNAVLTGWGSIALAWNIVRPTVLQTATVPLIDSNVCLARLQSLIDDAPMDPSKLDNVCTGPLDNSRISACGGDSGGPLAQQVGGVWELVGVVSWGVAPCGTEGAPSVYVRTSAYIDWIEQGIAS